MDEPGRSDGRAPAQDPALARRAGVDLVQVAPRGPDLALRHGARHQEEPELAGRVWHDGRHDAIEGLVEAGTAIEGESRAKYLRRE